MTESERRRSNEFIKTADDDALKWLMQVQHDEIEERKAIIDLIQTEMDLRKHGKDNSAD